jgi:outer membrane protein assembly factor BamB
VVASAPVFELWNYCPYLMCGERINIDSSIRFCNQCGNVFNVCSACRVTNRLLAIFCRGCGKKMETEAWPMQAGLRARQLRSDSINFIGEVQSPFPIHLGAEVSVQPIAADGITIISQRGGGVTILSELNGEKIGSLSFGDNITATPALRAGNLFIAAGKRIYSFDLGHVLDEAAVSQATPEWVFECAGGVIEQPLLIDETAIYSLASSGDYHILDAISQSSGQRLWPEPLHIESSLTAPPILVEDHIVLITSAGHVKLILVETGQVERAFPLNRQVDLQVSPFVLNHRVLLADQNGYLLEIILEKSGPVFNDLYNQNARISNISANEQFIALGHMAGLTLLSSRGNLQWSSDTIESISVPAIVSGETVFALDDAGNGLLFNALKSNPVARVKMLSGEISTAPLMTRSRIVAVSEDGKVAAIDWN